MGRWWGWRRCRRRMMCSPRRAWGRDPRGSWDLATDVEPQPTTHVGHAHAVGGATHDADGDDPRGSRGRRAPAPPRARHAGGARPLLRLMTRALGVPLRSVTPQLRRLVFARDGGRCIVPGCKHWRFIDVHHVVPRAHRGPNRLENLACLCTAHHRAVHEGVLAIEGSATSGWVVRHAGAGVYGRAWGRRSPAPRSAVAAPTRAWAVAVRAARAWHGRCTGRLHPRSPAPLVRLLQLHICHDRQWPSHRGRAPARALPRGRGVRPAAAGAGARAPSSTS
jgi:hypothetical protein